MDVSNAVTSAAPGDKSKAIAADDVHTLSNLLTIVFGSLEQLRQQSLDEPGRRQLTHAEAAVRQAGQLLQKYVVDVPCLSGCPQTQDSTPTDRVEGD